MAVVLMMAQSKSNANSGTDEVKPTIFHDFLGKNCTSDSPPATKTAGDVRPSEASPTASASAGASSGGGRGPISTTSDLGSERQVGNHFEGVPFYGPRSDFSGPEISNRFAGSKRSNSDSGFMGSLRDGFPQMGPESSESSHLMKMLRNAGGERPRRSHEEEMFFSMHQMRPTAASLILQPPPGIRTDANVSRWERAIPINVSPTAQYHPRAGQVSPFGYQIPSNRSKDANVGPSVISHAAADEGSRTGIKGSGILSSINASGGVSERISERNPSGLLPSGRKQKSVTHISEPESSIPPSRHGLTSASRQMTIFYGGQAHVFDDVHPNKADVIMALAGSNGGSWSTTYLPKSAVRPSPGESCMPSGENETGVSSNFVLRREFRGRLPVTGSSSHGFGTGDRISVAPGGHQGIVSGNDTRTAQAAEPASEEKREV
uniref:Protein TIFY n=1 Tax=Davidia involucrata TaxID=16924 RepID=A0A5B6ZWS8_DAVIN